MKIYIVVSEYNSPDCTNDWEIEEVFQNRDDALGYIKDEFDRITNDSNYDWIKSIEDEHLPGQMPDYITFGSSSNYDSEYRLSIYILEKQLL